jgi:hypothetical protein
VIVKEAPGLIYSEYMVAFEFKTTVAPVLIIAFEDTPGTIPQLQLPGFSHALLTIPVQVFTLL